jgi:hypothetical protein
MRFLKNFLMSIGAVAMAAALMNLFAPQTVHATVAALVEVSNPATNPALTSRIDDPGRIPYTSVMTCSPGALLICSVDSGKVPVNHRLVIENISGYVGSPLETWVSIKNLGTGSNYFFNITIPTTVPAIAHFNEPVRVYVDQYQSFRISTTNFADGTAGFTVSGYLLDCNAAPCAAIASF